MSLLLFASVNVPVCIYVSQSDLCAVREAATVTTADAGTRERERERGVIR